MTRMIILAVLLFFISTFLSVMSLFAAFASVASGCALCAFALRRRLARSIEAEVKDARIFSSTMCCGVA